MPQPLARIVEQLKREPSRTGSIAVTVFGDAIAPRGTMASPNTVMTIEPVREGSRFNSSTMRASGGGMRQGIPRLADS